jgi:hypothetical protein
MCYHGTGGYSARRYFMLTRQQEISQVYDEIAASPSADEKLRLVHTLDRLDPLDDPRG